MGIVVHDHLAALSLGTTALNPLYRSRHLARVAEVEFKAVTGGLSFQVSLLIRRELTERAKDFSLILDDVAITELSFSREYTAAVEAKQVGELMPNFREGWALQQSGCSCLLLSVVLGGSDSSSNVEL